jgi:hypothetical protein
MYIRDYKGNVIFIDLTKLKSDRDKYILLWETKYNIRLKEKEFFNENLKDFINGKNIFE